MAKSDNPNVQKDLAQDVINEGNAGKGTASAGAKQSADQPKAEEKQEPAANNADKPAAAAASSEVLEAQAKQNISQAGQNIGQRKVPIPGHPDEYATEDEWNQFIGDTFMQWREKKGHDAHVADLKAQQSATASATAPADNNLSDPELHQKRLRQYGPGYVVAKRNGIEQIFTAVAWDRLKGDNNTDGWARVVETPPEVKKLQSKE
jgi:hypothetical protein